MIFLIVTTNDNVLVTLVGAQAENYDFCFTLNHFVQAKKLHTNSRGYKKYLLYKIHTSPYKHELYVTIFTGKNENAKNTKLVQTIGIKT